MSTLDVRCEQVVARDPEDVWNYVAEGYLDHHGAYDPAVVSMRLLSGAKLGMGAVGEEGRRFAGRTQRTRFEVAAFERPSRFAISDLNGPFALDRVYTFHPHDSGCTRVEFRFTMSPRGPMRLLFPLLRHKIEGQVRENIARLPAAVEGRPSRAEEAASRAARGHSSSRNAPDM